MRDGVRLALDWGQARIGVAACDRSGILSFPVTTVTNDNSALDAVMALVSQYEPSEVLLGLPVALSGREELAAGAMRRVATDLAARLAPTPLRLVDERLSSASAHRSLASAGRDSRRRRSVIDQAAAVAILELALETERRTGTPPGQLVDAGDQHDKNHAQDENHPQDQDLPGHTGNSPEHQGHDHQTPPRDHVRQL